MRAKIWRWLKAWHGRAINRKDEIHLIASLVTIVGLPAMIIGLGISLTGVMLDHPPGWAWTWLGPGHNPEEPGKQPEAPPQEEGSQPQDSAHEISKIPEAPPPDKIHSPPEEEPHREPESPPQWQRPKRIPFDFPLNPSAAYAGWNREDALKDFSQTLITVSCPSCEQSRTYTVDEIRDNRTLPYACGTRFNTAPLRSWINEQTSLIKKLTSNKRKKPARN
jgi:hypothetical protein